MRRLVLALVALLPLALACEPAPELEDGELVAQDVEEGVADGALASPLLFEVRRDVRKCAFPMCGGYFVTAIQRTSVVCPDGKRAATCYVPDLDLSGVGLPAAQESALRDDLGPADRTVALLGVLKKAPRGGRASFAAAEAYRASGRIDAAATAITWSRISTQGVTCAFQPCETLRAQKVNSTTFKTVNGVELDRALPLAQRDQALLAAYSQGGLLVAHTTRTERNGSQRLSYAVPSLVFQRYEAPATTARVCGSALETTLLQASAGLLQMSETDAPFTWFSRSGVTKPSSTRFKQLVGAASSTPVQQITVDQFFARSTRDDADLTARDQASAAQFRNLKAVLQGQLKNLQVFRVGAISIDVYVVGATSCGELSGLKTQVVET